MARPTKLTDDTVKKITSAIQVGATYELACKYAGISYQTFRNWMERGEKASSGIERELFDAVAQAEGAGAVGWLAKIEKAANEGTWQAAAWKLERRYPETFGRSVVDQRHSGRIDVKQLSDAELEAIVQSES